MSAATARIFLKSGHVQPVWAGHPWVFAQAIAKLDGEPEPGAEVVVCDAKGEPLGRGLYSPSSAIAVRLFTRDPGRALDEAFFEARIRRALERRREQRLPSVDTTGYRAVHAEGDGLPGLIVDVTADLRAGRATVQRTQLNAWGVMHVLHTFTGAPAADSRNRRDWTLTTVWALSMDAVAAGLIVMVLGSYVMWFRLRAKRLGGIVALALGFISCGTFLGALRWLL